MARMFNRILIGAWLVAFLYLPVMGVQARRAKPKATPMATVPVSIGDTLVIGGQSYRVDPGNPPVLTLIPPIPPPPGNVLNVQTFGAKGDDSTDDTAAIQKTLNAAKAGDTVYVPAGTYKLTDQLKWANPPACLIRGDGPTSVLHSVRGQGLYLGVGGEAGGPVVVTLLKFTGTPGATMTSGTASGGVQIFGPNNCVISNCDFQSTTSGVYDAGPVGISHGTQIKSCRINDWARVGLFLNGGELVDHCTLSQIVPGTSHGIYSHASDITIQDTVVTGAMKYGAQIYSEDTTHAMDNVSLLRDTFTGCHDGGVTLAHSQMGAGNIHNFLMDSCQIRGTTAGSGLTIKNGDGVTVKNTVIDGSPSYGLQIGLWAPYEPGMTVQNVAVTGCTIGHSQVGIITFPSSGGTLNNIVIQGTKFISNHQDIQQMGSTTGIVILP